MDSVIAYSLWDGRFYIRQPDFVIEMDECWEIIVESMDDRIPDISKTVWQEFRYHEFSIKYSEVVKYNYA